MTHGACAFYFSDAFCSSDSLWFMIITPLFLFLTWEEYTVKLNGFLSDKKL